MKRSPGSCGGHFAVRGGQTGESQEDDFGHRSLPWETSALDIRRLDQVPQELAGDSGSCGREASCKNGGLLR